MEEIKRFLLTDIGIAYYDGKKKRYLINFRGEEMYLHRAVYIASYGDLSYKAEVHHVDHNRFNNHVENLVALGKAEHRTLHEREGYRESVSFKVIENTLEEAKKDAPVILTYSEPMKIDKYDNLAIELGYY